MSLEHPLEKSPLLLQNIRELLLALLVLIRRQGVCVGVCIPYHLFKRFFKCRTVWHPVSLALE
jgi:hypothetical protein